MRSGEREGEQLTELLYRKLEATASEYFRAGEGRAASTGDVSLIIFNASLRLAALALAYVDSRDPYVPAPEDQTLRDQDHERKEASSEAMRRLTAASVDFLERRRRA